MSIDYFWYVPAGDRDTNSKNWRRYYPGDKNIPIKPYEVFVAHGGNSLIDELFLFDNKEDAQWFYAEGYRGMLLQDAGVTQDTPNHMYLNIACDDQGSGRTGHE